MTIERERAADWVRAYGRTWEEWNIEAWVDLFTDDAVYVVHPTLETVRGRAELDVYVRKEQREQGDVSLRMGDPLIEGDRVAAEFWATGAELTIPGAFIAHLDADGRCRHFREYWFELDGPAEPFPDWGS